MALSPADFYAYSRATGVEIPEDPQERAAMAPEVLEFRRNQLKAPQHSELVVAGLRGFGPYKDINSQILEQERQNILNQNKQESNPLQFLGTSALAVGATIGAGLAARRFLGRGQQIPKAPAKSATAGVTQADLDKLQTAAGRKTQVNFDDWLAEQKRLERQQVYETVAAKSAEELPLVYRPKGDIQEDVLITSPITGEIYKRGQSPQGTSATYVAPSKEPGEIAGFTSVSVSEALGDPTDKLLRELGEMQAARKKELTSRMSQAYGQRLQKTADELIEQLRSETADLTTLQNATENLQRAQFAGAVESGEDQMTGRMKSQLQRNEDNDMSQVEMLENIAYQNQNAMMEEANPSQVIGYEPDAAINQAASQLPDGLPLDQSEGTRSLSSQELADIAKEEMIALRQDLEARGLRPGSPRFERALAKTWTTKGIEGAEPGTTEFRRLQDLGQVDISLPAVVRKAVDVVSAGASPMGLLPERTVSNIGPGAKITSTAAGTAIRGASPSYYTVPPVERTRLTFGTPDPLVIDTPDEVIPDYPSSYTALHQILANPQPPERIDPYAQKYLKGGEAGIGVYGVEPRYVPGAVSKETGEYSKAATKQKPTYVPAWLQKKELPPLKTGFERLPTASIESLIAGEGKAPLSKTRMQMAQDIVAERNRAKESLALSEVLRRARIEGRDPQDFLRNFGRNI